MAWLMAAVVGIQSGLFMATPNPFVLGNLVLCACLFLLQLVREGKA